MWEKGAPFLQDGDPQITPAVLSSPTAGAWDQIPGWAPSGEMLPPRASLLPAGKFLLHHTQCIPTAFLDGDPPPPTSKSRMQVDGPGTHKPRRLPPRGLRAGPWCDVTASGQWGRAAPGLDCATKKTQNLKGFPGLRRPPPRLRLHRAAQDRGCVPEGKAWPLSRAGLAARSLSVSRTPPAPAVPAPLFSDSPAGLRLPVQPQRVPQPCPAPGRV